MNRTEIISILNKAEVELKELLSITSSTLSVSSKNNQDYISDALEDTQCAISSLLKVVDFG